MTNGNVFLRTSDAAYGVNREGRVIFWNKAAEKTWGYVEDAALGQHCWDLLCGRDVFGNSYCGEDCPIRGSVFAHELGNQFQLDFLTATGERKRFNVNPLQMPGPAGEAMFVHLCKPDDADNGHSSQGTNLELTTKLTPKSTLSSREIEVLASLHKGLAVAEIADNLGISIATVRNHTQHIFFKLQAHSRFEAVARGQKLGLI